MEFFSKELEFKFNGEDQKCRFPTIRELKDYQKDYAKTEEKLDVIEGFLIKLGLKEEVVQSLHMDHLTKIIEEISGAKKN